MPGVLAEISEKATGNLQPVSAWTAAFVVCVALFANSKSWPTDLSAKFFPVSLVSDYEGVLSSNRVFTTDQWGDYLLWTGYPSKECSWTAGAIFYGDEIGSDYLTILEARPGWREAMDRYKVNMVLVPPETPLDRTAFLHSGLAAFCIAINKPCCWRCSRDRQRIQAATEAPSASLRALSDAMSHGRPGTRRGHPHLQ